MAHCYVFVHLLTLIQFIGVSVCLCHSASVFYDFILSHRLTPLHLNVNAKLCVHIVHSAHLFTRKRSMWIIFHLGCECVSLGVTFSIVFRFYQMHTHFMYKLLIMRNWDAKCVCASSSNISQHCFGFFFVIKWNNERFMFLLHAPAIYIYLSDVVYLCYEITRHGWQSLNIPFSTFPLRHYQYEVGNLYAAFRGYYIHFRW